MIKNLVIIFTTLTIVYSLNIYKDCKYFENIEVEDSSEKNSVKILDNYVEPEKENIKENWWTYEEYDLLCRLVYAEGGADTISDETQQLLTVVPLNRIKSNAFPNTLYDVVYQTGQYSCSSYLDSVVPSDRVKDNVLKVLNGEVIFPEDIVWQSSQPQSAWNTKVKIYKKVEATPYDIYFCHYGEPY